MTTSGSLQRGLAILVALGEYERGVGSSQLARDVDIPVSSVHRLLNTLTNAGFVIYDPETRHYQLGTKVFELSHRVPIVRNLMALAANPLQRLADETGETSLLAIRDGNEMIYLQHMTGWQSIQVSGSVGERGPLHCTAMGKVLLAFLEADERKTLVNQLPLRAYTAQTLTDVSELLQQLIEVRVRGYAIADEEHEEQVRAIGVPVLTGNDQVAAAICLAGPVFRVGTVDLLSFLPMLQQSAREIGVRLH